MIIRVDSRTVAGTYRTITIASGSHDIVCSCGGAAGGNVPSQVCPHIDAVIIMGETAMVHADDWSIARGAHQLYGTKIKLPRNLSRTWLDDREWREIGQKQGSGI